jgi:hypothetical protein
MSPETGEDHIFCENCWRPGAPMLCGAVDEGWTCPEDCANAVCLSCLKAWLRHDCHSYSTWRRSGGPRR